jgi:4-hydroxy-4-methyl-2-oxoglutarate aldolase
MAAPLTDQQLADLRKFGTCTIANAIETFNVRLRNEGFADRTIRSCAGRDQLATVGYAATARIRCSNPRKDGHAYLDRTDWWNYLLTIPAPRVVVIEDVDEAPGTGSFVGEVHASILKALGTVAVVTNGTVRDVPEIDALGMPVFASGYAVSHAYAHIVDFGTPVKVGGLAVHPGDLLHADLHGLLTVPLDIAAQIPAAAQKIIERERKVLEVCHSDEFSLEKLRAAVRGVFD